MSLQSKRILVVVCGGVAAYKAPELVRRLRDTGAQVRCVMTEAAGNFIGATTLAAVSGSPVVADLFDDITGMDVGHIRLAREADLIIVAPATANTLAQMAHGIAGNLATSVLLARSGPVLVAPAMNPKMWDNPATRRTIALLRADGIGFIGPEVGEMAESGEAGLGRMAEPLTIVAAAVDALAAPDTRLAGLSFLVTSGPTEEPLDPVRFISNRSSGKQGHAIARALAAAGASVRLISGPVGIADPKGVTVTRVETAAQMLAAVEASLPVDGAIFAAAVADWRAAAIADQKIKKMGGTDEELTLKFVRNPDILATVGHHTRRPRLVVGFAAETQDLIENARAKLNAKGADWIFANDVSAGSEVFGGENNHVHLLSADGVKDFGAGSKTEIAGLIVEAIVSRLIAQ